MHFKGKRVLVTGASRGISKAVATEFAEHGAHVAVHFHSNRAAAGETLQQLAGSGHMMVQANIADPTEVREMVTAVIETFNGIDILVNNAGIFEYHPIGKVDYDNWLDAWERTIGTNLTGAANVAYLVACQMIHQGGGRIINITSRGAFRGEPDAPAYGASKAGLNSMSQSLAQALAPHHIIVTAIAPGWVETDMAAPTLADDAEKVKAQSPLKRIARPGEIAKTVLFLASDEVEYITGAIVDVNGASYLRN